jgi:hypothetical protein
MGKTRRGHKEYSREQQLLHNNKKLKREIASLRKQLARVDLDRYNHIKDMIERSYQMEEELEGKEILEKLKKNWKCYECARGYMEIVLYNRPDSTWYYRHCTNCSHRTSSKRYVPGKVEGIVKDEKID